MSGNNCHINNQLKIKELLLRESKYMTNSNMEQMKKLIEAKKKKGSQSGSKDTAPNKVNGTKNKAFKNTKKSGSLNK